MSIGGGTDEICLVSYASILECQKINLKKIPFISQKIKNEYFKNKMYQKNTLL